MFQQVGNPIGSQPTSFWDGCFNERMDTLIARNHRRQVRLQRLPSGSTLKMVDDVRELLPLADRVHVARMLEKNPDIVRSVTVPGQAGSPVAAKAAAPLRMIHGTAARVWTLLTTVGMPSRPRWAGYGGRCSGWPRLPSSALSRTVSSPSM